MKKETEIILSATCGRIFVVELKSIWFYMGCLEKIIHSLMFLWIQIRSKEKILVDFCRCSFKAA